MHVHYILNIVESISKTVILISKIVKRNKYQFGASIARYGNQ